ncbi:MAG TPA: hypothetical protein GXZ26_01825 [Firmicutes bacterium]|nr:hypothetical protein [Bacillota bacterium]
MAEEERRYSYNLLVILKETVVDAYNHMGYTLFSSVLWLLVVAPLVMFAYLTLQVEVEAGENLLNIVFNLPFVFILIFYSALVIAPVNSALLFQAYKNLEGWSSLRGFWKNLRRKYWQTVGVYLLYGIAFSLLIMNIAICFYLLTPLFTKIVGIFNLYLLLFLILAGFYLPPLIVLQENTIKKVLKKAFLLAFANGPQTFLVLLILSLIGLLFSFLLPLLVMVYGGILQFFIIRVFLGLLEKYEAKSTVKTGSE